MTIEILPEDHALLERLVGSGRFATVTEAVHEVLNALADGDTPSQAWKQELESKIGRGLDDEAAGRMRPASQFLAELRSRQGQ